MDSWWLKIAVMVGVVCAMVAFLAWRHQEQATRPRRQARLEMAAAKEAYRAEAQGAPSRGLSDRVPIRDVLTLTQEPTTHRRQLDDRPVAKGGAPNVVLVIACTLRRDQLSPYGGPVGLTPFVSQLAGQGSLFEDVVGASSWTKASMTAILTGRHPVSIGLVEPKDSRNHRVLSPLVTTLAEQFTASGYYTLGVTGNPNLNTEFGLAQGFDQYTDTKWIATNKRPAKELAIDALKLLDARTADEAELPFFLQLIVVDGHEPRRATRAERERHQSGDVSKEMALYRVMVEHFDSGLQHLDQELNNRGFDSTNTIFILTADHGEGLMEPRHHGNGHGRVLFPSLVAIPWIVRGPGVAKNHRIAGLVSHTDIVPTIAGLLELEADPALSGFDWSGQLAGEPAAMGRQRAWSDTWFLNVERSAIWTPSQTCHKDYRGMGGVRCFDRLQDPTLAQGIELPALESELDAWRAARLEEYKGWSDIVDADVDETTAAQLEALGYVDN
ncbi:MAG: sulfatase [Proteobacteria bacterium]|nr:sulfatase [Pseudomonadota bacterium]